MKLTTALSVVAFCASAAHGYKYPSSVNDTSSRDVGFLLTVSEVTSAAYFNKNIQLDYASSGSKDLATFINPVNIVGEFVLKNGTLQVASKVAQYAAFTPLPTKDGIIRHAFTFTTNKSDASTTWELLNVGNGGLFSLLNNDGQFAKFNAFVICNTTEQYHYSIEYQSGKTPEPAKGCENMALHTYMGPPF